MVQVLVISAEIVDGGFKGSLLSNFLAAIGYPSNNIQLFLFQRNTSCDIVEFYDPTPHSRLPLPFTTIATQDPLKVFSIEFSLNFPRPVAVL